MKLMIVSDSHGDRRNLRRAVVENPDAQAMFFLGDGLRDVEAVAEEFPALRLYCVSGNNDLASFAPSEGLVPCGGLLIFYTHGHRYQVKSSLTELAETAAARGADIALYGHTHSALQTREVGVTLFNPGSVSGVSRQASYGVLEIENGKAQFTIRYL